jgi:hypothetical protein
MHIHVTKENVEKEKDDSLRGRVILFFHAKEKINSLRFFPCGKK